MSSAEATEPPESPGPDQPQPGQRGWRPAIVCLDIDGTLVDADGHIRPRTRQAVTRAATAGAHVVLATGRSVLATVPVARDLGLDDTYVVSSNGAVTARLEDDGSFELVDVVTFDARPIVTMLHHYVPGARFAVEELGVGYRVSAPFPPGELAGEITVLPLSELVAEPVTRVVVRHPDQSVEDFLDLVERTGLHGVNYAVGYTAWLDLAPEGVSKASALEKVRHRLGVDAYQTLAIGDGRNDQEMLEWAARGVAMGDAPPAVQDAADAVTETFDDDGAAVELERWF